MTLYEIISKDKELKKALHTLDFEIIKLNLRGSKYGLSKETSNIIKTFAREGAGGVFAFWGEEDGPVVYISSEGQCGRFATNLAEALIFITSFPFAWMDMLHCSGTISEMRDSLNLVEKERKEELDPKSNMGKYYESIGIDPMEQQSKIKNASIVVSKKLGLEQPKNSLELFVRSVNEKPHFIATAKDGSEYELLSGKA